MNLSAWTIIGWWWRRKSLTPLYCYDMGVSVCVSVGACPKSFTQGPLGSNLLAGTWALSCGSKTVRSESERVCVSLCVSVRVCAFPCSVVVCQLSWECCLVVSVGVIRKPGYGSLSLNLGSLIRSVYCVRAVPLQSFNKWFERGRSCKKTLPFPSLPDRQLKKGVSSLLHHSVQQVTAGSCCPLGFMKPTKNNWVFHSKLWSSHSSL